MCMLRGAITFLEPDIYASALSVCPKVSKVGRGSKLWDTSTIIGICKKKKNSSVVLITRFGFKRFEKIGQIFN